MEHGTLEPRKRGNDSKPKPSRYETILIDVGSGQRVAVNHIIGAITERTGLSGRDIGRVEIFPDQSVVEIPVGSSEDVLEDMMGCKINGNPVKAEKLAETLRPRKIAKKSGTSKKKKK